MRSSVKTRMFGLQTMIEHLGKYYSTTRTRINGYRKTPPEQWTEKGRQQRLAGRRAAVSHLTHYG
jgi:hypothetical protein